MSNKKIMAPAMCVIVIFLALAIPNAGFGAYTYTPSLKMLQFDFMSTDAYVVGLGSTLNLYAPSVSMVSRNPGVFVMGSGEAALTYRFKSFDFSEYNMMEKVDLNQLLYAGLSFNVKNKYTIAVFRKEINNIDHSWDFDVEYSWDRHERARMHYDSDITEYGLVLSKTFGAIVVGATYKYFDATINAEEDWSISHYTYRTEENSAHSFDVGITWRAHPKFCMGLSYLHGANFNARFRAEEEGTFGEMVVDEWDNDLAVPSVITFSASFEMSKGWSLHGGLDAIDFSDYADVDNRWVMPGAEYDRDTPRKEDFAVDDYKFSFSGGLLWIPESLRKDWDFHILAGAYLQPGQFADFEADDSFLRDLYNADLGAVHYTAGFKSKIYSGAPLYWSIAGDFSDDSEDYLFSLHYLCLD